MWKSNIKRLVLVIFTIAGAATCFGQNASVQITKKKCTYASRYSGEKLIIRYNADTLKLLSEVDYGLFDFIKLSDSSKLLIIEKLLEYENDTSLCCMDAIGWSFNGIEGCRGKPKNVTRYPIQVDALFMINRLCWPRWMELYSCSQVLYDNKLKKSINDNPKKVRIVFEEYRKWFLQCKANGSIGYYFPFNAGRYGWYGGRKSGAPKE